VRGWSSDAAPRGGWQRAGLRWAAVLWLCVAPAAWAQIYTAAADDPSAPVLLSNFASEATPRLLLGQPSTTASEAVAAPVASAPSARPRLARKASAELAALIDEVAREVQVSALLLHAVIAEESNFDPRAVSPKGALGLMQLLPKTASRFGARQAFDPRDNIRAGARYLRWLAALFDNRLDLVLAAYNAGEQNVIRAGGQVPGFPETRSYVRRILASVQCSSLNACASVAGRS